MRISIEWLGDYVDLPADTLSTLAHDLTMSTVEVERVIDVGASLDGIVVARVVFRAQHPNAERLCLAQCDIGGDAPVQVVCGGTNVTEGMLVALALPGSHVLGRDGQPMKIKRGTLRGEASDGMLCGASEVGLTQLLPPAEDGHIVDLAGWPAIVGAPLAQAIGFDDQVIEIDNKSLTNRPDLWGHYGIARELAALYGLPLKPLPAGEAPPATGDVPIRIEDPVHCTRYTLGHLGGVRVAPAPNWMRSRLARVGQRPINNLVDLTNYVMMAVGQPSHAFDQRDVGGGIVVRPARTGEALTLLDGTQHTLDPEVLVIANTTDAVALAGVMGGEHAVRDDTTAVLLEVASFEPVQVRRTARRFGLRTESSSRFDKGIDQSRVDVALGLFGHLLDAVSPGATFDALSDAHPTPAEAVQVTVDVAFVQRRLGQDLDVDTIVGLLGRLGFQTAVQDGTLTVAVPPWRATGDVSIPVDLVEEVGRLYGYENLPFRPPVVSLIAPILQPRLRLERRLREALATRFGLREVWSTPWVADRYADAAGMDGPALKLAHPPAPDMARLQTTLIPQLLRVAAENLRYFGAFGVFELNRVFEDDWSQAQAHGTDALPTQRKSLAGALVGDEAGALFLRAKALVLALSRAVQMAPLTLAPAESGSAPWADDGARLQIELDGAPIGVIGALSAQAARKAGVRAGKAVALFEISVAALQPIASRSNRFAALPAHPEVDFDLSLIVERAVRWSEVEALVGGAHKLIQRVRFIEEYTGPQVGEGNKSITLRITLGARDRTLVGKEVDKAVAKVTAKLRSELGATIREA